MNGLTADKAAQHALAAARRAARRARYLREVDRLAQAERQCRRKAATASVSAALHHVLNQGST